jgi:hypothetical protein
VAFPLLIMAVYGPSMTHQAPGAAHQLPNCPFAQLIAVHLLVQLHVDHSLHILNGCCDQPLLTAPLFILPRELPMSLIIIHLCSDFLLSLSVLVLVWSLTPANVSLLHAIL